jgi:hypothetical protein
MDKQGSFPHKFKVGQVVRWGNGVYAYVQIVERHPLHCDGGCPSYRVFQGEWNRHEFVSRCAEHVSEDVLRPLIAEEVYGKEFD